MTCCQKIFCPFGKCRDWSTNEYSLGAGMPTRKASEMHRGMWQPLKHASVQPITTNPIVIRVFTYILASACGVVSLEAYCMLLIGTIMNDGCMKTVHCTDVSGCHVSKRQRQFLPTKPVIQTLIRVHRRKLDEAIHRRFCRCSPYRSQSFRLLLGIACRVVQKDCFPSL